MAAAETPDFIEAGERRLFCVRHLPGRPPRGQVLVCHPFGEEKKSSHRALVEMARLLADRGFACVRFDFTGCGDSSGRLEHATVAGWIDDVGVARQHLARHVPAGTPCFLLGLRLGASIAAAYAAGRQDVAGLALWQPLVNGKRAFAADLRRTLIKQMVTDGASKVTREELVAHLESGEGRIDLDGFLLTGALYRGIAAIDLLGPDAAFRGPTLIAQLAHNEAVQPDTQALADAARAAGADVTVRTLVAPPLWARIDRVACPDLLAATADWVEQRCGGEHA